MARTASRRPPGTAWERRTRCARAMAWGCALRWVDGACVGVRACAGQTPGRRSPRRPWAGRNKQRIYGAYRIRSDGACVCRAADSRHHQSEQEHGTTCTASHRLASRTPVSAHHAAGPGAVDTVRRTVTYGHRCGCGCTDKNINYGLPGGLPCPRAACALCAWEAPVLPGITDQEVLDRR